VNYKPHEVANIPPELEEYDRQFSLVSTTKTTMLKNAQFKRRTKLSHKPLVHAVNPSAVV
jgi:hypothetical protein